MTPRETDALFDQLAQKLHDYGIRAEFGSQVAVFLGDDAPEKQPRTCLRAVVTLDGIIFVVEIISRYNEATYTVMRHEVLAAGGTKSEFSHQHTYFTDHVLTEEQEVFLFQIVDRGKWMNRKGVRMLAGPIVEASTVKQPNEGNTP